MSLVKFFVGLCVLTLPLWAQDEASPPTARIQVGQLMPAEQTSSWFTVDSFAPDFSPQQRRLPEEALTASKFSLPPQAPISLQSLFVDSTGELDPMRSDGRFNLPAGNYLRFGYDLDHQNIRYNLNDGMNRESIYGPGDVAFHNLSAHLHEGEFTKSAYYVGHFNLAPRTSVDLGARWDQTALRPGDTGDKSIIYPRITLNYEFTSRFRLAATHGHFAEYTVFGYEDSLNEGQRLLNGLQPLSEQEIFHIERARNTAIALEYDLTKRSTLRVEGFDSKADRGMNFSLRHKR